MNVRVVSQLGPRVDGRIRAASVEGVDLLPVPVEGPVPDGLHADVLFSFRRSPILVQLAACGVGWVHIAGAGVEGIPRELFDGRTVTCSRGAHAVPIAEFVLAAILAFEKRLPQVWVQEPPRGEWLPLDRLEDALDASGEPPWTLDPPDRWGWAWLGELDGRTLGLAGMGGIAIEIAKRALPFGMRVVATRRRSTTSPIEGVEIVGSLEELLPRADHVVIALPETDETRGIFDARAFGLMRPGAHLINVARGSLVDERALLDAIDCGHLSLATLDVAAQEPLPLGHPFLVHPRVRLSPHVSWAGPRRQERAVDMFIDNLRRYSEGRPLAGVVDPALGY